MRLDDDLYPWLLGAASGQLPPGALRWRPDAAVCVVLAAAGYPGKVRSGDVIDGLPLTGDRDDGRGDGVVAFHAGTRRDDEGQLLTAGGRVLGVTGSGADLTEARARVYGAIKQISFSGMHHRTDIGMRGKR
jgi:phosphoribosylamine--glycine ligase